MADDRTEQPTQRRLEKSREKGQFAISRDFVAAVQWMMFVWLVLTAGEAWLANSASSAQYLLQRAFAAGDLNPQRLIGIMAAAASPHFASFASAGFALLASSLAAHLAVTQLGFSAAKIAPDFTRLNPLSKLKQMPSQNMGELVKAILLLPLFGYVLYKLVMANLGAYLSLPFMPVRGATNLVAASFKDLFIKAAAILLAYGLYDFFKQRAKHGKTLKMSKQEIRQEHKESEGNPQIKGRMRKIQRDMARRRMMQAVPEATAVIVNPTHYAVAILYNVESMTAPKVVAKGKNYLALRIRQKGVDHGVPIVENAPLAQALYLGVDVGQEIPAQFYKAIAEILAYIYRILHGKLPG